MESNKNENRLEYPAEDNILILFSLRKQTTSIGNKIIFAMYQTKIEALWGFFLNR